eukprot:scaffold301_cov243-Pinguiococcus_pyrenoidosus.AAC.169
MNPAPNPTDDRECSATAERVALPSAPSPSPSSSSSSSSSPSSSPPPCCCVAWRAWKACRPRPRPRPRPLLPVLPRPLARKLLRPPPPPRPATHVREPSFCPCDSCRFFPIGFAPAPKCPKEPALLILSGLRGGFPARLKVGLLPPASGLTVTPKTGEAAFRLVSPAPQAPLPADLGAKLPALATFPSWPAPPPLPEKGFPTPKAGGAPPPKPLLATPKPGVPARFFSPACRGFLFADLLLSSPKPRPKSADDEPGLLPKPPLPPPKLGAAELLGALPKAPAPERLPNAPVEDAAAPKGPLPLGFGAPKLDPLSLAPLLPPKPLPNIADVVGG